MTDKDVELDDILKGAARENLRTMGVALLASKTLSL